MIILPMNKSSYWRLIFYCHIDEKEEVFSVNFSSIFSLTIFAHSSIIIKVKYSLSRSREFGKMFIKKKAQGALSLCYVYEGLAALCGRAIFYGRKPRC